MRDKNLSKKIMELFGEGKKEFHADDVYAISYFACYLQLEIFKRIDNLEICAEEYRNVVGPERMETETEINERYEYLMGRASLLESILREALTAYENER